MTECRCRHYLHLFHRDTIKKSMIVFIIFILSLFSNVSLFFHFVRSANDNVTSAVYLSKLCTERYQLRILHLLNGTNKCIIESCPPIVRELSNIVHIRGKVQIAEIEKRLSHEISLGMVVSDLLFCLL